MGFRVKGKRFGGLGFRVKDSRLRPVRFQPILVFSTQANGWPRPIRLRPIRFRPVRDRPIFGGPKIFERLWPTSTLANSTMNP